MLLDERGINGGVVVFGTLDTMNNYIFDMSYCVHMYFP
jgi:hypothetical protein